MVVSLPLYHSYNHWLACCGSELARDAAGHTVFLVMSAEGTFFFAGLALGTLRPRAMRLGRTVTRLTQRGNMLLPQPGRVMAQGPWPGLNVDFWSVTFSYPESDLDEVP
jgi:hypothetical protein